jgi:IstB-like ATP binding protein
MFAISGHHPNRLKPREFATEPTIRLAALLDRLTHRCQIFEMKSESFRLRFRESMKKKGRHGDAERR